MARQTNPGQKQKNLRLAGTSVVLLIIASVIFLWFAMELASMF